MDPSVADPPATNDSEPPAALPAPDTSSNDPEFNARLPPVVMVMLGVVPEPDEEPPVKVLVVVGAKLVVGVRFCVWSPLVAVPPVALLVEALLDELSRVMDGVEPEPLPEVRPTT